MNTILQKRIKEAACEESSTYDLTEIKESNAAYSAAIKVATFILQNQWISVDEALPEEKFDDGYQFVFVRIHLYDDTFYYDTDYIRKGKWELHKNQKITHWMQIPSLKGGE